MITSDHVIKTQETEPISTNRRKSSQTDQTPKLRDASIDNPLKAVKSPKVNLVTYLFSLILNRKQLFLIKLHQIQRYQILCTPPS